MLLSRLHLILAIGLAACGGEIVHDAPGADPTAPAQPPSDAPADPGPSAPTPPAITCTGASSVHTLASGQELLSGLAANQGSVLFSEGISNEALTIVGKDGAGQATLYAGGRIGAADEDDVIAVTGIGNAAAFGLVRVPLHGGAPVTLVSNVSVIGAVAMDRTHVYWTTSGDVGDCFSSDCPRPVGAIFSVPRAGGDVVTLASGAFAPAFLQLDDHDVYWASPTPGNVPDAGTSIGRVPKSGGSPVRIAALPDAFIDDLKSDATTLYWSQASLEDDAPPAVMRVGKSGGTPATVTTLETRSPGAIGLDGASVWWLDGATHSLMKAPKTGGAPSTVAPDGVTHGSTGGLVVDASGVYWTTNVVCGQGCTGDVLRLSCP